MDAKRATLMVRQQVSMHPELKKALEIVLKAREDKFLNHVMSTTEHIVMVEYASRAKEAKEILKIITSEV